MISFLLTTLESIAKPWREPIGPWAELKVDTLKPKISTNPLLLRGFDRNGFFFSKGNLCPKRGAK